MTTTARVPPHDLHAEEALLASCLLSRQAVDTASDITTPEAFYRPANGHIFHACQQLAAGGEPVDAVTVHHQLQANGITDVTIADLSALDTPSSSNAARYAHIIEGAWTLRQIAAIANDVAEIAYTPTDQPDQAVDQAEAAIYSLAAARRNQSLAAPIHEHLPDWLDELEARCQNGGIQGVPTGWTDLDRILAGLRGGQLVTIAGRPAMGKSACAGILAANAARAGHPVLFVSAEMSRSELNDRFVAAHTRIDLTRIRRGELAERDWERLTHMLPGLADLPLDIDPNPDTTILTIRASARRTARRYGRVGLVIVDYLQLVNTTLQRPENRQVEVADLSRRLKKLALELDVPVVALAQLNRNLEHRNDKRPILADLRESGAIENDSDVVCFLYRDEVYNPETNDRDILEINVAKQRNGPLGTVRLAYLANIGLVANLAPQTAGGA